MPLDAKTTSPKPANTSAHPPAGNLSTTVKVKSSPRHYALGSHEGLYGQCLNLVSVVRSNLECSYTDSPGRDTSPSQVPSKQCLYSFAAEWTEAK